VAKDAATKAVAAGQLYTEPGGVAHFALTRAEPVVVYITGFGPTDTVVPPAANDSPISGGTMTVIRTVPRCWTRTVVATQWIISGKGGTRTLDHGIMRAVDRGKSVVISLTCQGRPLQLARRKHMSRPGPANVRGNWSVR